MGSPEFSEEREKELFEDSQLQLEYLKKARKGNELIALADFLHVIAETFTGNMKRSLALVGSMAAIIGLQYLVDNHEVTMYSTLAVNTIGGTLLGDAIRPISRISESTGKYQARKNFEKPEYVQTDNERLYEVRNKLVDTLVHEEGIVPPEEIRMWLESNALHADWKNGNQFTLAHMTDAKLGLGDNLTQEDTVLLFLESQREAQIHKQALWRLSMIGTNKTLDIVAGNAMLWAGWAGVRNFAGENYALLTSIADDITAVGIAVVTTPVKTLLDADFIREGRDKIKNLFN